MSRMSSLVCAAALLAGSIVVASQEHPVFNSSIRTVPIYATVVDAGGRLVPDLQQSDFSIVDNNKPADVTLFSIESQPFTAV